MLTENESEDLYVKLELRDIVDEGYEEFVKKYGSFKMVVDRIAGAVNIKEYGEFTAKLAAQKAYRQGLADKEEEMTEKYRAEKEGERQQIGELLSKLVEDICKKTEGEQRIYTSKWSLSHFGVSVQRYLKHGQVPRFVLTSRYDFTIYR